MTPSLAALIERAEGPFEGPVREWAVAFHAALPEATDEMWGHFVKALQGDLNAAVAFTEALLPEAKKLIREEAKDWVTTHWRAVLELPTPPYTMVGDAPTPALALVLAALKAHAAKETT